MRRTLALLGATALAVAGLTGLAGPANADNGIQATAQFGTVTPDTSGTGDAGSFELENPDSDAAYNLEDHAVIACVAANTDPFIFARYGTTGTKEEVHAIPAEGNFLTVDSGFVGIADYVGFDAGDLDSNVHRLELVENLGDINDEMVVATTQSGSPNSTCLAKLPSQ